jgi:4-hydroxybenzoate polyprenyltransferase
MMSASSILKLIRPKTLFWFSVTTCFGFASLIQQKIPDTHFFYLVLTIVFANIGAIIINDIADIEVDKKSPEEGKRLRPLVTGIVSKKEAIIIVLVSFSFSLFISTFYDFRATIFSIIVIVFSLTYSLPPTKFCARPFASILYWIVLCIVCYFLMLNALTISGKTIFSYLNYTAGWVFISGIILFMGIAEIMAKDLRDLINDKEGGRNTFVNYAGVSLSSRIMLLFSWFGFILWMESLYLTGRFSGSIFGILCFILGFFWCIRITVVSLKLSKQFNQQIVAKLHQQWTYIYATMQVLTFLSFIKN